MLSIRIKSGLKLLEIVPTIPYLHLRLQSLNDRRIQNFRFSEIVSQVLSVESLRYICSLELLKNWTWTKHPFFLHLIFHLQWQCANYFCSISNSYRDRAPSVHRRWASWTCRRTSSSRCAPCGLASPGAWRCSSWPGGTHCRSLTPLHQARGTAWWSRPSGSSCPCYGLLLRSPVSLIAGVDAGVWHLWVALSRSQTPDEIMEMSQMPHVWTFYGLDYIICRAVSVKGLYQSGEKYYNDCTGDDGCMNWIQSYTWKGELKACKFDKSMYINFLSDMYILTLNMNRTWLYASAIETAPLMRPAHQITTLNVWGI